MAPNRSTRRSAPVAAACGAIALFFAVARAQADTNDTDQAVESWAIHGQFTNVTQYHPAFRSPYRGTNSLDPGSRGDETVDATLFLGVRLWGGGELWADPEVDQGFGLSQTFGIA